MKTPSQLRQWASGSNAKNVDELIKLRHTDEVDDFSEKFDYVISMAKEYGSIYYAERADGMCAEILKNGTDNQKLFEIAFKRIDEAIWLVGRLKAAQKQKEAEALISYDKMHGGLFAPILNKFRKLLS